MVEKDSEKKTAESFPRPSPLLESSPVEYWCQVGSYCYWAPNPTMQNSKIHISCECAVSAREPDSLCDKGILKLLSCRGKSRKELVLEC